MKDHIQLQKEIETASRKIRLGGLYYHYKHPDKLYKVMGLEVREETEEVAIAYQSLYGNGIMWNRLLSEWLKPAVVDGNSIERFVLVVN